MLQISILLDIILLHNAAYESILVIDVNFIKIHLNIKELCILKHI